MRKMIKNTCLLLAVTALASCWDDDNLQVLVPDSDNSYLEQYRNRVNNANERRAKYISYATRLLEQDPNHPDKQVPASLLPDEYVALPDGQGYVGVVDLGLSVKWAASNMTSRTSKVQQFASFFEPFSTALTEVPDELVLEHLFSSEEYESGTLVPLELYKKNNSDKAIVDIIDAFNSKITSLTNNYASHRDQYYIYLWLNKYYFLRTSIKDDATTTWGDEWREPTAEELQELADQCTWSSTISTLSKIGALGLVGTAPNGHSIFLPGIYSKSEITKYTQRLVRK